MKTFSHVGVQITKFAPKRNRPEWLKVGRGISIGLKRHLFYSTFAVETKHILNTRIH